MKRSLLITGILVAVLFSACKKEDDFSSPLVTDYFPLEIGKYVVYKSDSLLFTNFGKTDTVVSYQVKLEVARKDTDLTNKERFVIQRYIRKNAGDEWVPENTFFAVNTGHAIEYVENNLRFIKLQEPIRQDFSWKGNSYINTNDDLNYYDNWDYIYDSINVSRTLEGMNVDSTIKVSERDSYDGGDVNDETTLVAYKTFSEEIYAKNIGLVYKSFVNWEYQRSAPYSSDWHYEGYGVTLTMIDHN